jgi:hypothetical protein
MPTHSHAGLDRESVVDAGEFGCWLAETLKSFKIRAAVHVPCGACRACCTSSYFIPIERVDRDALAAIPVALLRLAPASATGQRILGYRPDGTCAMFMGNECSIYPRRPQACRSYDCRVLAAAGLMAGGDEKSRINDRVRTWRFSYGDADAMVAHRAVKQAATFIATQAHAFPNARAPTNPGDIAVLALKVHRVFMDPALAGWTDQQIAGAIVASSSLFESEP